MSSARVRGSAHLLLAGLAGIVLLAGGCTRAASGEGASTASSQASASAPSTGASSASPGPDTPKPAGEQVDSSDLARRVVASLVEAGSVRLTFRTQGQVIDAEASLAQGRAAVRMPNPIDPTGDLIIVDGVVYVGGGSGAASWTSFPLGSRDDRVAELASLARLVEAQATTEGIRALIAKGTVGEVSRDASATTYEIVYRRGEGERSRFTVDSAYRPLRIEVLGREPVEVELSDYGLIEPVLAPPAAQVTPL